MGFPDKGDSPIRTDDVILTTCTNEGTSNPGHVTEVDNEEGYKTNNGLIWEFKPDEESGSKGEGSDNIGRTHPDFTTYAPPPYMLNVDLDVEFGLEFPELTHRRLNYTSSSLNVDDLQVGNEFSSKDVFVAVVKWYNIKYGVNFHVTKSRSEKYEVKCAKMTVYVRKKIMSSVRKKTRFWIIKKYNVPYTYVVASMSQDYLKKWD
ncbi:hypothetical protein J1N35_019520 [Gossypium stocksii]|uniref:Transposase MuDR plant domain-containing protein n=1 Tax=Gossypium stocksii TaxID=47602 RepID=A0A9D3VSP2_9ROSI|nr:hypothetical protein J1N35_019520 [Gossypium stocksii]